MTIKKSNTLILNLKAFSTNMLQQYIAYIYLNLNNKAIKTVAQPTLTKKLTILRSPHKYKRAQEHFQIKMFKSIMIFNNTNINELYKILLNKPKGIFVQCKLKQN